MKSFATAAKKSWHVCNTVSAANSFNGSAFAWVEGKCGMRNGPNARATLEVPALPEPTVIRPGDIDPLFRLVHPVKRSFHHGLVVFRPVSSLGDTHTELER